jgi:spermidine synthase
VRYAPAVASRRPVRSATFPTLATLFFFSGVSGLVYQVVWFRMLARAFGVTVYAVTTVLVVFMAGLAIGSLCAERLVRGRSLLRAYGVLELLVGVTGAAASLVMPLLPELLATFSSWLGSTGAPFAIVRGVTSCLVLLPTTALMGATLPVLSGHVAEERDTLGSRAGLLYGFNTLGAVVGVAFAGFVLIAALGERRTIAVAVGLNVAIGAVSLVLARRAMRPAPVASSAPSNATSCATSGALSRRILIVSLVSGLCALSFEVVWFRVLTVLLGNSVYAFSCMLGAYLVGIGAGSVLMARWIGRLRRPVLAFAVLELGVAALALISLRVFLSLGVGEADASYAYALIWRLSDFGRLAIDASLVVLPATFLYGAIFPVATRLVAAESDTPEAAVGRLYGYNTIGGILGSALTGVVLIPLVGTHVTFLMMAALVLGIGLYLLAVSRTHEGFGGAWIAALASLAVVGLLLLASREDPFVKVLERRAGADAGHLVAHEEDPGAAVSMFENAHHRRTLYINGLYVSNTSAGVGEEMINFPLAFDPDPGPKRVLAVGLGVGEALRYAVDVGHEITVVELHPKVVDLFRRFNPDHAKYLENPRARVVIDDGRNYLLNTSEKYDLILVDGSPPLYASGMVNLYSLEFARLAKQHLTPNGTFVVWFPVVCFADDFWMTERNFADTFSSIATLSPPGSANALMMGANAPKDRFALGLDELTARLARWRVRPGMNAVALASGLVLPEAVIREVASRYPTVTDDRPRTEFPLFHFLRGEPYQPDNRFLYPWIFPPGTHRCAPGDLADCTHQCDAGQIDSCFLEGALHLDAKVAPVDDARAVLAFRRACDGGDWDACSNLGFLTQSGRGVAEDDDAAASLFKRACDGGALIACHHLGLAYQNGRGVPRDDRVAALLARHACAAELWAACVDLGQLYESGRGVARDVDAAARLYDRACSAKYAPACSRREAMAP